MSIGTQSSNFWTVAVIIGFVALVCVPVILFQRGFFDGRDLVDAQGNVVGRSYSGDPNPYADRYHEAMNLLAAGENEDAEEIYRQLSQAEPQSPDPYIGIAGAKLRQLDLKEARRNYAKAIELDESNPQALYGAGAVEEMEGNLQEAKVLYQQALSASSDHLLSLYGMANVCKELGEEILAKKFAQRYVQLASDSDLKREMLEMLDALIQQGQPDQKMTMTMEMQLRIKRPISGRGDGSCRVRDCWRSQSG